MKVGLVAIHCPKQEHRAELMRRVRRAAELARQMPGCLSADCWTNPADGTVVTIGQWDSPAALGATFAALRQADIDFDYDEREVRPREVIQLVSADDPTTDGTP